MSITDELRGFIEVEAPCYEVATLLAIANRIDEHHAEAQRRWMAELDAAREQSFNAGFDDGFASADDWLAQHEDAMREHGWVKLPKDADGEPIHIGDRMDNGELVVRIVLTDGSWEPSVYTAATPNQLHEYYCHAIRHHKQPTVEDVLRDMHMELNEVTAIYVGEAIDSDERDHDAARIFAKYATKLRLAGDAE